MMVIRPVCHADLAGLMRLAKKTGGGLTSLPQDEKTLAERIERSVETWQGERCRAQQGYVFVLEDTENGVIAGISAIEVAVGLEEPWYNYRVGSLVHASRQLDIYNPLATLSLSNDHTGATELCSRTTGSVRTANCCRNHAFCLWPAFRRRSLRRSSRRCAGYSMTPVIHRSGTVSAAIFFRWISAGQIFSAVPGIKRLLQS